MDWFLYDIYLRHEKVNKDCGQRNNRETSSLEECWGFTSH